MALPPIEDVKDGDFAPKKERKGAFESKKSESFSRSGEAKEKKQEKPTPKLDSDYAIKPKEKEADGKIGLGYDVSQDTSVTEAVAEKAANVVVETMRQGEELVHAVVAAAQDIEEVLASGAVKGIAHSLDRATKSWKSVPQVAFGDEEKSQLIPAQHRKKGHEHHAIVEAEDALREADMQISELQSAIAKLQMMHGQALDAMPEIFDGLSDLNSQLSEVAGLRSEIAAAIAMAKQGYPHNIGALLMKAKGLGASADAKAHEVEEEASRGYDEARREVYAEMMEHYDVNKVYGSAPEMEKLMHYELGDKYSKEVLQQASELLTRPEIAKDMKALEAAAGRESGRIARKSTAAGTEAARNKAIELNGDTPPPPGTRVEAQDRHKATKAVESILEESVKLQRELAKSDPELAKKLQDEISGFREIQKEHTYHRAIVCKDAKALFETYKQLAEGKLTQQDAARQAAEQLHRAGENVRSIHDAYWRAHIDALPKELQDQIRQHPEKFQDISQERFDAALERIKERRDKGGAPDPMDLAITQVAIANKVARSATSEAAALTFAIDRELSKQLSPEQKHAYEKEMQEQIGKFNQASNTRADIKLDALQKIIDIKKKYGQCTDEEYAQHKAIYSSSEAGKWQQTRFFKAVESGQISTFDSLGQYMQQNVVQGADERIKMAVGASDERRKEFEASRDTTVAILDKQRQAGAAADKEAAKMAEQKANELASDIAEEIAHTKAEQKATEKAEKIAKAIAEKKAKEVADDASYKEYEARMGGMGAGALIGQRPAADAGALEDGILPSNAYVAEQRSKALYEQTYAKIYQEELQKALKSEEVRLDVDKIYDEVYKGAYQDALKSEKVRQESEAIYNRVYENSYTRALEAQLNKEENAALKAAYQKIFAKAKEQTNAVVDLAEAKATTESDVAYTKKFVEKLTTKEERERLGLQGDAGISYIKSQFEKKKISEQQIIEADKEARAHSEAVFDKTMDRETADIAQKERKLIEKEMEAAAKDPESMIAGDKGISSTDYIGFATRNRTLVEAIDKTNALIEKKIDVSELPQHVSSRFIDIVKELKKPGGDSIQRMRFIEELRAELGQNPSTKEELEIVAHAIKDAAAIEAITQQLHTIGTEQGVQSAGQAVQQERQQQQTAGGGDTTGGAAGSSSSDVTSSGSKASTIVAELRNITRAEDLPRYAQQGGTSATIAAAVQAIVATSEYKRVDAEMTHQNTRAMVLDPARSAVVNAAALNAVLNMPHVDAAKIQQAAAALGVNMDQLKNLQDVKHVAAAALAITAQLQEQAQLQVARAAGAANPAALQALQPDQLAKQVAEILKRSDPEQIKALGAALTQDTPQKLVQDKLQQLIAAAQKEPLAAAAAGPSVVATTAQAPVKGQTAAELPLQQPKPAEVKAAEIKPVELKQDAAAKAPLVAAQAAAAMAEKTQAAQAAEAAKAAAESAKVTQQAQVKAAVVATAPASPAPADAAQQAAQAAQANAAKATAEASRTAAQQAAATKAADGTSPKPVDALPAKPVDVVQPKPDVVKTAIEISKPAVQIKPGADKSVTAEVTQPVGRPVPEQPSTPAVASREGTPKTPATDGRDIMGRPVGDQAIRQVDVEREREKKDKTERDKGQEQATRQAEQQRRDGVAKHERRDPATGKPMDGLFGSAVLPSAGAGGDTSRSATTAAAQNNPNRIGIAGGVREMPFREPGPVANDTPAQTVASEPSRSASAAGSEKESPASSASAQGNASPAAEAAKAAAADTGKTQIKLDKVASAEDVVAPSTPGGKKTAGPAIG